MEMEGDPHTLAEWKNFGNKQFVLKRYNDAIKAYTAGLSLCNYEDPDLLANRAAAYLNLERYTLALKDVDAVLKAEPSHIKAIHRKARALSGLAKYEEAISFLKKAIHKNKKADKDLLQLLQKAESMFEQQKTGEYNTDAYLYSPFAKIEDWAEFFGPVEIKPIPGKGRGLVATDNLREGQLVMACKAYAVVFLDPDKKKEDDPVDDNVMHHEDVAYCHDFSGRWLVQKLYEKIKNAPETGSLLYQLFAGEELGYLDPNKDDCSKPDISRISGICRHNTFCNSGDSYATEVEQSVGLWILPSYMNHLCIGGNCTWRIYGDFILIRAFRSISKGDELIFSYASPTWKYHIRNELLTDRLGFVCTCQLCILDRQLAPAVITVRERLQKLVLNQEVEFLSLNPNATDPDEAYKKFQASCTVLEEVLKRLDDLHPNHGILTVLKVDALQKLGMKYFGVGEFEKAAEYMLNAHKIMLAVGLPHGGIECMLWVVGAYLQMRNTKMAKYWIQILKKDTILAHGTVNVLNLMGDWVLSAMEEQNVSL